MESFKNVGRAKETADDKILQEIYLHDDPALVAKELVEPLDMSRQGLHNRLQELETGGWLNSKRPGRDRIYWLTDGGRDRARSIIRQDY